MKKYKLTTTKKEVFDRTLYQIEAIVSFGSIIKGELGGWIEKEENLSQENNAWVSGDAQVFGNAQVSGDARVYGDAQVSGDAQVFGNAQVFGDAWVSGDAQVFGKLKLIAGFFFGMRYKKEEIKYIPIENEIELIYKGEAKFGEDDEINDATKQAIELLEKNGFKIVKK